MKLHNSNDGSTSSSYLPTTSGASAATPPREDWPWTPPAAAAPDPTGAVDNTEFYNLYELDGLLARIHPSFSPDEARVLVGMSRSLQGQELLSEAVWTRIYHREPVINLFIMGLLPEPEMCAVKAWVTEYLEVMAEAL